MSSFPPWQPITTAPKDGTTVLLWVKRTGLMVGYWGKTQATTWNPPGWVGGHCMINHIDQPTHWMPLPEPPL